MPSKKAAVPSKVQSGLDSIANLVGKTVADLWIIFVRQYFIRGVNFAFTAVLLLVTAYILKAILGVLVLLPILGAIACIYGAIAYIGNPKYYAMFDVLEKIDKVKEQFSKKEDTAIIVQEKSRSRYPYIYM
jgi:hypothetical protein